ncbi:MAG: HAD family hydrolase [Chloroflexi bacterium]|nr:HAD family hydrolase [Chloroflexota bacterium]
MSSLPAVFLDRDGTMNVEVNDLRTPDGLQLIAGAAEAIARLKAAGYAVVVVTNQSGVARGYMTLTTLDAIHRRLAEELARHGTAVDGIYTCVHHPDENCPCRKPRTSLFHQAAQVHDIDFTQSVMIGDKDTDLLAAMNLQMPAILVRTGFGHEQLKTIATWTHFQPIYIADDIRDAADWWLHYSNRL